VAIIQLFLAVIEVLNKPLPQPFKGGKNEKWLFGFSNKMKWPDEYVPLI
jgi:hypothetical protein